mmetsp:Transcript_21482/g.74037  ORF Transcript_21482/g.74037 Transcript_21482/m.74037 type:complete len:226 (+) Transcript_21482:400-1077(+)
MLRANARSDDCDAVGRADGATDCATVGDPVPFRAAVRGAVGAAFGGAADCADGGADGRAVAYSVDGPADKYADGGADVFAVFGAYWRADAHPADGRPELGADGAPVVRADCDAVHGVEGVYHGVGGPVKRGERAVCRAVLAVGRLSRRPAPRAVARRLEVLDVCVHVARRRDAGYRGVFDSLREPNGVRPRFPPRFVPRRRRRRRARRRLRRRRAQDHRRCRQRL